jgi:hypothetical protein
MIFAQKIILWKFIIATKKEENIFMLVRAEEAGTLSLFVQNENYTHVRCFIFNHLAGNETKGR